MNNDPLLGYTNGWIREGTASDPNESETFIPPTPAALPEGAGSAQEAKSRGWRPTNRIPVAMTAEQQQQFQERRDNSQQAFDSQKPFSIHYDKTNHNISTNGGTIFTKDEDGYTITRNGAARVSISNTNPQRIPDDIFGQENIVVYITSDDGGNTIEQRISTISDYNKNERSQSANPKHTSKITAWFRPVPIFDETTGKIVDYDYECIQTVSNGTKTDPLVITCNTDHAIQNSGDGGIKETVPSEPDDEDQSEHVTSEPNINFGKFYFYDKNTNERKYFNDIELLLQEAIEQYNPEPNTEWHVIADKDGQIKCRPVPQGPAFYGGEIGTLTIDQDGNVKWTPKGAHQPSPQPDPDQPSPQPEPDPDQPSPQPDQSTEQARRITINIDGTLIAHETHRQIFISEIKCSNTDPSANDGTFRNGGWSTSNTSMGKDNFGAAWFMGFMTGSGELMTVNNGNLLSNINWNNTMYQKIASGARSDAIGFKVCESIAVENYNIRNLSVNSGGSETVHIDEIKTQLTHHIVLCSAHMYMGPFAVYSNELYATSLKMKPGKAQYINVPSHPTYAVGSSSMSCPNDKSFSIYFFPKSLLKPGTVKLIESGGLISGTYSSRCKLIAYGSMGEVNLPKAPRSNDDPPETTQAMTSLSQEYTDAVIDDDSPVKALQMCASNFREITMLAGTVLVYARYGQDYYLIARSRISDKIFSTKSCKGKTGIIYLAELGEHFEDGYDVKFEPDPPLDQDGHPYLPPTRYAVAQGEIQCDRLGVIQSMPLQIHPENPSRQEILESMSARLGTLPQSFYEAAMFSGELCAQHFMVARASLMHNTFRCAGGTYTMSNYAELGTYSSKETYEFRIDPTSHASCSFFMYPDGPNNCSFGFASKGNAPRGNGVVHLADFTVNQQSSNAHYYVQKSNIRQNYEEIRQTGHHIGDVVFASPTSVLVCGGYYIAPQDQYDPSKPSEQHDTYQNYCPSEVIECGPGMTGIFYDPWGEKYITYQEGQTDPKPELPLVAYVTVKEIECSNQPESDYSQFKKPWITRIEGGGKWWTANATNNSTPFAVYRYTADAVAVNSGEIYSEDDSIINHLIATTEKQTFTIEEGTSYILLQVTGSGGRIAASYVLERELPEHMDEKNTHYALVATVVATEDTGAYIGRTWLLDINQLLSSQHYIVHGRVN